MADPTGAYLLSNRRGAPCLWPCCTVLQNGIFFFSTHTNASTYWCMDSHISFFYTILWRHTGCMQYCMYLLIVWCVIVLINSSNSSSRAAILWYRIYISINTVSCLFEEDCSVYVCIFIVLSALYLMWEWHVLSGIQCVSFAVVWHIYSYTTLLLSPVTLSWNNQTSPHFPNSHLNLWTSL